MTPSLMTGSERSLWLRLWLALNSTSMILKGRSNISWRMFITLFYLKEGCSQSSGTRRTLSHSTITFLVSLTPRTMTTFISWAHRPTSWQTQTLVPGRASTSFRCSRWISRWISTQEMSTQSWVFWKMSVVSIIHSFLQDYSFTQDSKAQ